MGNKGIVYVMSCTQGLLKIGCTQTDQFENRMSFLENNGYQQFNGFHREFAVEVDDYRAKESLMHRLFDKSQVKLSGKGIEMFAVDINLVIDLMKAFGGRQVYPPLPAVNNNSTSSGSIVRKQEAKPLTFSMIGIPVGSELTYKDDPSRKAVTVDNKNHILWNGQTYTLSGLASLWRNGQSVQGGAYWLYNGKTLVQIRKDLENNG